MPATATAGSESDARVGEHRRDTWNPYEFICRPACRPAREEGCDSPHSRDKAASGAEAAKEKEAEAAKEKEASADRRRGQARWEEGKAGRGTGRGLCRGVWGIGS